MSVPLASGVPVLLHGQPHTITKVDLAGGFVELAPDEGPTLTLSVEEVVHHPALVEASTDWSVGDDAAQRLDSHEMRVLQEKIAHVYEAETGFRSGTPTQRLPHEPRPEYDPATTGLMQRRAQKARDLSSEAAEFAGIKMSERSIRRISKRLKQGHGLNAAVDRRHVRRFPGQYTINGPVEKACEEVYERTRKDSNKSHASRYVEAEQYMQEVLRMPDDKIPSESTVTRWFRERFTPSELNGKGRSRRSAVEAPTGGFSRPNPTRPGALVCIDTCSINTLLKGTEFAEVVNGVIVPGMDWYSRSIVVARVLEGSEKAIDVSFVLQEIGRPKATLPGFAEEAKWAYVGLPSSVLADVYGGSEQDFSGLPMVNAEAVVTDHGSTYKAHVNVAAAARLGVSILPARVRRGSDKQVVERTFDSLRTMLLERLSGYRGTDVAERGENVEARVKYTVQDIEDIIVFWAVRIWQNHVLSDVRPEWCPEGDYTPNMLYEYALAQTGQPLRVMSSDDYYAFLHTKHVKVHPRGVKIRNFWYDDRSGNNVLADARNTPSPYGGNVKGKWTVKYDPRDLRRVFFLDKDGNYQPLIWVAASRHTPCFSDRHATALFRVLRDRNISPTNQNELAEILLRDILRVHEPVENWPTLPAKTRKEMSRRRREEELLVRDQDSVGVPSYEEQFETEQFEDEAHDDEDTATTPAQRQPARPPSSVTALDEARMRKNTDLATATQHSDHEPPATEGDGIVAAPPLTGSKPLFSSDLAALAAMHQIRTGGTDPNAQEPS